MKLTNQHGHPEEIYRAILKDPYDKGDADFSVTELLGNPREAALRARHHAELEEDVEDCLPRFYGQITHEILARAARGIVEKRYFGVIERTRISGKIDHLTENGGILSDWKFAGARKFKGGRVPEEWEAQLNMLLDLLRQNGLDARALKINGLIRDWSWREASWNPYYPQRPVVQIFVRMWPREETRRFMRERVILHKQARITPPECSPRERWAEGEEFAVMRRGRQSAVAKYTRRDLAELHAKKDESFYVAHRPGENKYCDRFCSVRKFCTQYASLSKANLRRQAFYGSKSRYPERSSGERAPAPERGGIECNV